MLVGLKLKCRNILAETKTKSAYDLLDTEYTRFNDPLFCPYQIRIISDKSPVLVIEKGRQIGYSWLMGFRAVLRAASDKKDTVYMSYNRESAKDFMRDVHKWCRIFNLGFSIYEDECIDENSIHIFECNFLNLRKIIAISGDCTNLRGKPGADVIIDEAAYNQNPINDLIAASMATLIHGGTVTIGGTHAGIDNDFNHLLEKIKAGELPYKHMKITFKDAVSQGLFKRICAKKKEQWSQEKEKEWIDGIYKMYGIRGAEELDAIPSDYSQSGQIFNNFKFIDINSFAHLESIKFRYHDLAASEDKQDLNASACYSASVQITLIPSINKMVISDWSAEKVSPLEGDAMIEHIALADGSASIQIIEQEPGSTGLKYVAIMQERLISKGLFQVYGYPPRMGKIKRAIPVANAIQSEELMIDENLINRSQFCNYLQKFSAKKQPLTTDLVDCISGCFDYIKSEYNWVF